MSERQHIDDPEKRVEPTHPEPEDISDAERPAVLPKTEARQGKPLRDGAMRRIMIYSIVMVVVAFAIIYFSFF